MVKIGVIGAGHLGKIHLKLLKEIPSAILIGFYDFNPEVASTVEKEFGVKSFSSAEKLMDACEAIDIVTPTTSHFEYSLQAIKSSKNIFVEKPLTNTVDEGDRLLRAAVGSRSKQDEAAGLPTAAADRRLKIQVGHVERFNPAFVAAKKYLDDPMFIETHRLAEFNPRGTDVSVVHDLMIHDIDIVLSTVKSPVKKISASGVSVVSDSPDIANARIEFENGCVANMTASRISLKNMRKSRFFQKDAYISVDFLKKKTEVVRLSNLVGEAKPLDIVIDLGNGKGSKLIYFDNPKIEESNAIKSELEFFLNSIINDVPVAVSIENGYRALETAHRVMKLITNE
jgi:predicted dehydrogenase